MHPILNKNLFFVKEHVGMFKAANNFDIIDPETEQVVLICREEKLGFFTKLFRFTDYKRMTPFHIEIKLPSGETIISLKRGLSVFLSTVEVLDGKDQLVGRFKQKFFSIGGKFGVYDANDNFLCMLKGKWTSWSFKFVKDNTEFAHVSKKWAGLGKELFTTADNYMLEIDKSVPQDHPMRMLILSAVMCIDMVLKE
ncbi:MAG: hypothetical protein JW717_09665 [Marinilabiliaceae bacterium]|nr:hypothetical protein [Marinilabiliaceae bacterium]